MTTFESEVMISHEIYGTIFVVHLCTPLMLVVYKINRYNIYLTIIVFEQPDIINLPFILAIPIMRTSYIMLT